MLNTKSVKHNFISDLWVPDDIVEVAAKHCVKAQLPPSKTKSLSLCLRFLEVGKDARLEKLNEQGLNEEDLIEELLWFDIEWPRLSDFALCFGGASSFQKIFPVVLQAGFARQRYIKRHPKSGARICDEDGVPLVYATYQEAQLDETHPGTIIHQAYFESEVLNEAIAGLDRPPSPSDGGGKTPLPSDKRAKKNEDTQRDQTGSLGAAEKPSSQDLVTQVGNYVTTEVLEGTIPPPSSNYEGDYPQIPQKYHKDSTRSTCSPSREGNVPSAQGPSPASQEPSPMGEDPVRQSVPLSNTNISKEDSVNKDEITLTSEPAAVISHFDFFREMTPEAVMELGTLILPLPAVYASPERKAQAEGMMKDAARKLAKNLFLRERGLIHLARLMYYFADETSPCQHRAFLRKNNPGVQMRLWMLTDGVVRIASKEMEAWNWFPPELSGSCLTSSVPEPAPYDGLIIDFAQLKGMPRAKTPGMDQKTVLDFTRYLRYELFPAEEFSGVYVDYGCIDRLRKDQGHYIEFWWKPEHMIRFYSLDEWYLIEDHAELLDNPSELKRYLTEACQAQVA